MRTPMSEIVDLDLTQSIERYLEMEPDEIRDAIVKEWPEQTAVLLEEFLFNTSCGNCGGVPDFIQKEREDSDSSHVAPVCSCKWNKWGFE